MRGVRTSGDVQPVGNRVLVRPLEEPKVTASGLYLPDQHKDISAYGEVLAIGPGEEDERGIFRKPEVAVGDIVLYRPWAGYELQIDGVEHRLIPSMDLVARRVDG